MTRHAWTVLFAVIGILATAETGSAQEAAAASFDSLVERVRIGQSIWVTDQAGREVRGTLERLTNNGGLGVLIGMAIDAAIPGRVHVVYEAPRRGVASRMSVMVRPLFSSRAKGLALSFAF